MSSLGSLGTRPISWNCCGSACMSSSRSLGTGGGGGSAMFFDRDIGDSE
jgi:hypothetical protein